MESLASTKGVATHVRRSGWEIGGGSSGGGILSRSLPLCILAPISNEEPSRLARAFRSMSAG